MPIVLTDSMVPALKKLVRPILGRETQRWVSKQLHLQSHHGGEFIVTRAKAIWNIALLLRSGELGKAMQVAKSSRIKVNSKGVPKGIEGTLVHAFVNARKPSVLRRTSACLRWYTGLYATEATEAQMSKSRRSINTPGPELKFRNGGWKWYNYDFLIHMRDQISKVKRRLPRLDSLSGASSYPSDMRFYKADHKAWMSSNSIPRRKANRLNLPFEKMVGSLISKGRVPKALIQSFGDHPLRQFAGQWSSLAGDDTFGRIAVLQEGGMKGRIVCSPNAWVALYTTWHKQVLMNLVNQVETTHRDLLNGMSCVTDQQRGAYYIQKRMNEGSPVYCVDQSSATDRFPLSLQQKILQFVGMNDLAEALDELRGPYLSPEGKWTYMAGQPMGLPPSFPLYHLTHVHFVEGIIADLGLPKDIYYCILGDDIVIFHPEIARLYRERLAIVGVEISEHKSFSGDLAEFAGFIFTKTNTHTHTYRPFKHSRDYKKWDVLNVTHAYGSSVLAWPGWKSKYGAYERTQGQRLLDLSPVIGVDRSNPGQSISVSLPYLLSITNRISWRETPVSSEFPLDPQKYLAEKLPKFLESLVQNQGSGTDNFDPYVYLVGEISRKKDWRKLFSGFGSLDSEE